MKMKIQERAVEELTDSDLFLLQSVKKSAQCSQRHRPSHRGQRPLQSSFGFNQDKIRRTEPN